MDQITATFILYFGCAAAVGVISNFQKPIVMWIASAVLVLTAFLLHVFAGPILIFALFYAVPYFAASFTYQIIGHVAHPTHKEIAA